MPARPTTSPGGSPHGSNRSSSTGASWLWRPSPTVSSSTLKSPEERDRRGGENSGQQEQVGTPAEHRRERRCVEQRRTERANRGSERQELRDAGSQWRDLARHEADQHDRRDEG